MRLVLASGLLAVVLPAALTACSSDGGGETPEPSPSSTSAAAAPTPTETTPAFDPDSPSAAVQDWLDAYADGDGSTICALQTDAFNASELAHYAEQRLIDEGEPCDDGMTVASLTLGAFGSDFTKAVVGEATENGDTAQVSVEIGRGTTTYSLVRTDGQWFIDAKS